MGIKGLTALLSENAPKAMKDHDIKTLFGRKVAIDASMSIYQFLVAVRQKDGTMLMNENGDVTSHLMGFFFRTLRMVDHGIKPMYVFDGKPPELKGGGGESLSFALAKRFAARDKAAQAESEAKEVGTTEDIDKLARRQVKPTRQHNEECRRLLGLMGIPVVVAPGEAEAQCAELARAGKVYAAGSEDMDTLTFNSPLLLRHLTFSEAKKAPISEINLKVVLQELEMNMEQFIELCILLGCDYLEPAKGIGPKTALKLMRDHGSLRAVVDFVRGKMAEKQAELDAEAEADAQEVESVHDDSGDEGDGDDKSMISIDRDFDLESEDGMEKRVVADMDGDEEKPGSDAGPSKGAGNAGGGKKKKAGNRILDSDDEAEMEEGEKEVVKKAVEEEKKAGGDDDADAADMEWEASPEPEPKPSQASTAKSSSPTKNGNSSTKTLGTKGKTAAVAKPKGGKGKGKGKSVNGDGDADGEDAGGGAKPKKKKPVARGGMQLPEYWPWEEAKKIFMEPDVVSGDTLELEWKKPDIEGLVKFLCVEKGFNEDRVRNGAARLDKLLAAKQQGRLDGFFKPMGTVSSKVKVKDEEGEKGGKGGGKKRKGEEKEKAGAKKTKGKK